MMENHHHMSPVYGSDLEFYSTNSTNVKSSNFVAGNNNNISSDAESGFSINVSTGESELIFDDLIELADENMSANSSLSSAASTPSPVISVQKMQQRGLEPRPLSLSPTTLPYHSRLHEALTQPRLPQQPVKCHRCGLELTSRCLMQTCADDTRCRLCGHDLTTKCILQVCTIPPKESLLQTQSTQSAAPRKRVHHYSTPQ
jgi:hypothetical protein